MLLEVTLVLKTALSACLRPGKKTDIIKKSRRLFFITHVRRLYEGRDARGLEHFLKFRVSNALSLEKGEAIYDQSGDF